jgi:toxin YoeB
VKFVFSKHAWEDYLYWKRTDPKTLKRIHLLIRDIQANKYQGIGKPEPLKHKGAGYWSRRINREHRLVYKIEGEEVRIAQLRYHY